MAEQFDQTMVDELADAFCEGVLVEQVRTSRDTTLIGNMTPVVTPQVVAVGVRAVLAALSQTHAVVPKAEHEGLTNLRDKAVGLAKTVLAHNARIVPGSEAPAPMLAATQCERALNAFRVAAGAWKEVAPDVR